VFICFIHGAWEAGNLERERERERERKKGVLPLSNEMAVASLREKFFSLGTNHEQSDLQTGPAFKANPHVNNLACPFLVFLYSRYL
jgi:hypothetical protein